MPLNGSIDAAVLCTATARSDTIMKITNTVPIAYSTSSIENSVTQKLETKFCTVQPQQVADQDRQHQDAAMGDRDHDRDPAPLHARGGARSRSSEAVSAA